MPTDEIASEEEPGMLTLRTLPAGDWLVQGSLLLQDRPGELAEVSSLLARHGANIERFAYNRSDDPNLVRIEARLATAAAAGALADELRIGHCLDALSSPRKDNPQITDIGGLLRIKVNLQDRPGTLAAFATILKEHRANVIFMSYDGQRSPGVAEFAIATECPEEVSQLLGDLNGREHHYHVEWQGRSGTSIDDIIGLSLVERFLLNLKAVLPREKLDELHDLIRSSAELQETLIRFKQEAGGSDESMAASEVFSSILNLATSSLSKTGSGFALRLTGPLELTPRVRLYMLTCPTGANAYLLGSSDEWTLIDSSYGLYYADAIRALAACHIDPSRIRHALFTHPDADHAGWAARLEADFGTAIHMHPHCREVFLHENRAYGSGTRLMALNGYYTRLINRFTDLRAPKVIRPFAPAEGEVGPFKVVGRYAVRDLELLVLESLGGHVPAQVFLYAPREGALFCGDYLIDFSSLSDRGKSTLSIAKYLMTSTNSDGRMFGREMRGLARLMLDTQKQIRGQGISARVFPGHGEFYRVDDAAEMLDGLVREEPAARAS